MKKYFKHISVASGVLLLMISFVNCSSSKSGPSPSGGSASTPNFVRIHVDGDNEVHGIFDPAIEYDGNGIGWMTYSWVNWPEEVVTHLAKSVDHGKTWQFVQALNSKSYENINGIDFVWRYETSTIVYDPTDVPAKRWKFFVQRVPGVVASCTPNTGCEAVHSASSIWYRYAAQPDGAWSAPSCLFGKLAWGCSVDINSLDPSLSINKGYNEIGSLVKDGVIYLSLDTFTTDTALGDWENRKVILISSANHGSTWQFNGALTDYDDAFHSGYLVFTATSLVAKDNKAYLLLAPSGSIDGANKAHDGTWVVEFTNLAQAQLKRDINGHLVIKKKINVTKSNGGESDYDEQNTAGGMVYAQLDTTLHPTGLWFQIYNTSVDP